MVKLKSSSIMKSGLTRKERKTKERCCKRKSAGTLRIKQELKVQMLQQHLRKIEENKTSNYLTRQSVRTTSTRLRK